ncbi:2-hydroxyacyl-CoA dehydratase [bacterium]|nr:2-hydroxyacyl-CoA dehydratase [bacterium]
MGAVPVRIVPRRGFIQTDTHHLRSDACSFCRSLPSILNLPFYQNLTALIHGACCDQMRRMTETLANISKVPVFLYGAPRTYGADSLYFLNEMRSAFEKTAAELSITIDESLLPARIKVRNRLKERVFELRTAGLLSTALLHQIAASLLPPEKLIEFLDNLESDNTGSTKVPVMLAGSIPGVWELKVMEESGAHIKADATCMGDRVFQHRVDENIDPWTALYQSYIEDNDCPHRRPMNRLIRYMQELAGEREVQGVIYRSLKFCHPWGLSAERMRKELNLPFLRIDDDLSSPAVETFRTRVGAFVEMLNS